MIAIFPDPQETDRSNMGLGGSVVVRFSVVDCVVLDVDGVSVLLEVVGVDGVSAV